MHIIKTSSTAHLRLQNATSALQQAPHQWRLLKCRGVLSGTRNAAPARDSRAASACYSTPRHNVPRHLSTLASGSRPQKSEPQAAAVRSVTSRASGPGAGDAAVPSDQPHLQNGDCEAAREAAAAIASLWSLPCTQPSPTKRTSQESTVSVLWGEDDWKKHIRADRFLWAVVRWPMSTILRGLAPILAVLGAWSWLVWHLKLTFTTGALGYLASPLGLLLAFRVNSVVSRFHEARSQWGLLIFHARDLASLLAASEALDGDLRARCCRLLVAFGWATKMTMHYERDMGPMLRALLPPDLAAAAAASRKPALKILSILRRATQSLALPEAVERAVVRSITELNRQYGGMERLMSTPLSPTYMRHTSRGLLLWLAMLPCGLLSAGCTTALKLALVVVMTAYFMIGIEEIGIQIEQPFDTLPLCELATVLTKDVADELL